MMMADDNEDDNNNDTNAQYKALWNLLTKYGIDRFSNDDDLNAYMETVKIATGTSDQQHISILSTIVLDVVVSQILVISCSI